MWGRRVQKLSCQERRVREAESPGLVGRHDLNVADIEKRKDLGTVVVFCACTCRWLAELRSPGLAIAIIRPKNVVKPG